MMKRILNTWSVSYLRQALPIRVAAAVVLACDFSNPLLADAELRFAEDFESYAPGSDLVGQNGWAGSGPGGFSLHPIQPEGRKRLEFWP